MKNIVYAAIAIFVLLFIATIGLTVYSASQKKENEDATSKQETVAVTGTTAPMDPFAFLEDQQRKKETVAVTDEAGQPVLDENGKPIFVPKDQVTTAPPAGAVTTGPNETGVTGTDNTQTTVTVPVTVPVTTAPKPPSNNPSFTIVLG